MMDNSLLWCFFNSFLILAVLASAPFVHGNSDNYEFATEVVTESAEIFTEIMSTGGDADSGGFTSPPTPPPSILPASMTGTMTSDKVETGTQNQTDIVYSASTAMPVSNSTEELRLTTFFAEGDFSTNSSGEVSTQSTGSSTIASQSAGGGDLRNTTFDDLTTKLSRSLSPSSGDSMTTSSGDLMTTGMMDMIIETSEGTSSSSITSLDSVKVTTAKSFDQKMITVNIKIVLQGSYDLIKHKQEEFKQNFTMKLSKILQLSQEQIQILKISSGSVVVDVRLEYQSPDADYVEDLAISIEEGPLVFVFDNQNYTFTNVSELTVTLTVRRFSSKTQLIFIVAGSVFGTFLILSCVMLMQCCLQRLFHSSKKSFDLTDEPCIKLSDFNMAHTYIPRPQSIYSTTVNTRNSFFPYESMSPEQNENVITPPFMYASGEEIREVYNEVREPMSPTTQTSMEFGRSGVPEMNLPKLEGVVTEGTISASSSTRGLHPNTHSRQTPSATFHPPLEEAIPPPPNTPPPSLPGDRSSPTSEPSSFGDTNQLIKSDRHDAVSGIDNVGVDLDSDFSSETTPAKRYPLASFRPV